MKSSSFQNNSIIKAIKILEYLATVDNSQDLSVISKAVGMNKSTVYRLLSTLETLNYIYQSESNKKYSLGAQIAWLSTKYLEKNEVRKIARPLIEELSRKIGESVHLGILDRGKVMYLDKINGQSAVVMASRVGERVPVHCTALGKALLAFRSENDWHEHVEQYGLFARTSQTITDPQQFYKELRKIQSQGYSLDNLENEEGIRCIATPIFNVSDQPVAAISVSGWTISMTMEKVQNIISPLQETSNTISARLGQRKLRD